MMLFVFVWLLRFLSNQLLSVCCITTRLNDLKEVFSRASWDTVDFNHDDIELPWSQWKDYFSLLLIMWFQL